MIDGTNVRRQRAPGWGSHLHLVTERGAKPILCALTARQRHENPQAIPLTTLERAVQEAIASDKGYSRTALPDWLSER